MARFVPRLFRIDYLEEILANRLNLHIDESGNQDLSEGRYIVAVVLHDHSSDIATPINRYEERLAAAAVASSSRSRNNWTGKSSSKNTGWPSGRGDSHL